MCSPRHRHEKKLREIGTSLPGRKFFIAGDRLERMMKQIPQIALATALILGGTTFALAQNGPATGGYPPAAKNPNLGYGYYDYYAPGYAEPHYGTPYSYGGYSYYYPGYNYGYPEAPGRPR
jgi:hypothetical protein